MGHCRTYQTDGVNYVSDPPPLYPRGFSVAAAMCGNGGPVGEEPLD